MSPGAAVSGRWLFAGLLLSLVWLPLPWGSNRIWAESLVTSLWLLLLTLWWSGRALGRLPAPPRRRDLYLPLLLGLAWLAWLGLQLLPLPLPLLAVVAPETAAAYQALPAPPAGATLSLAPGKTAHQLWLSLGYAALYLLVLGLARDRGRRRLLLQVVLLSALGQAAYGSLMTLSGLEWGWLGAKTAYLGNATGTFVNRNHYASYLLLGAAAALGLILADLRPQPAVRNWRQRLDRWLTLAFSARLQIRVALAVLVIGLVLSRSRMGNTAFFLSLGLTAALYLLLRARGQWLKALLLFASVVLVDALIISHYFGLDQLVQRIEQTRIEQEGRLQVAEELAPLVTRYALTGAGAGAFIEAYLPVRSLDNRVFFDHAHNEYLEWLIEVGVPGLLLLLSFVAVHALHALRLLWRRRDRTVAGVACTALMASTAMALHISVEFSLRIPAVAATLVSLLALVAGCSARPRPADPPVDGRGKS